MLPTCAVANGANPRAREFEQNFEQNSAGGTSKLVDVLLASGMHSTDHDTSRATERGSERASGRETGINIAGEGEEEKTTERQEAKWEIKRTRRRSWMSEGGVPVDFSMAGGWCPGIAWRRPAQSSDRLYISHACAGDQECAVPRVGGSARVLSLPGVAGARVFGPFIARTC